MCELFKQISFMILNFLTIQQLRPVVNNILRFIFFERYRPGRVLNIILNLETIYFGTTGILQLSTRLSVVISRVKLLNIFAFKNLVYSVHIELTQFITLKK